MAKAHPFLWRAPSRRDQEHKRFAALMRKVEALRIGREMSKTELAAKLETTTDAVRAWMTGRTMARNETVERIKRFLGLVNGPDVSNQIAIDGNTNHSVGI